MKVRALFAFVLCFMLTSTTISAVILSASAQSTTPLPSAAVTLKAFDSPKAYFIIQLSNVPSGCGITNGNYSGWCIDRSKLMERSPATHQVLLYSSLQPPNTLSNYSWNMVNYLLNHKQGNITEIQEAVWSFVNLNGTYVPPANAATTAMINDAKTNGAKYVPTGSQTIAVIASPVSALASENPAQISILEATANNILGNSTKATSTPTSTPATSQPLAIPSYIYLVAAAIAAVVILTLAVAVRKSRSRKA